MSSKHKREATKTPTGKRGSKERDVQVEQPLNTLFERIRAEYPTLFGSPTFRLLGMGPVHKEHLECIPPQLGRSASPQQLTAAQGGGQFICMELRIGTDLLGFLEIPVRAEGVSAEVESALDSAMKECVEAVTQTHEQIERNRPEIARLGEETRALIAEMLAA